MLDDRPALVEPARAQVLAAEIRGSRLAKGWTLTELAAAANLDKGYLSKVERGLKVPSASTVMNLARALDIPVAQLFGESVDDTAIRVSRAALRRQPAIGVDETGYRLEALTSGRDRGGLEGFLIFPPPNFSEDFRAEHQGEELLFVVDGTVEVRFADRVVELATGDALQFPGRLAHQLRRTSPSARVLIAVTRS